MEKEAYVNPLRHFGALFLKYNPCIAERWAITLSLLMLLFAGSISCVLANSGDDELRLKRTSVSTAIHFAQTLPNSDYCAFKIRINQPPKLNICEIALCHGTCAKSDTTNLFKFQVAAHASSTCSNSQPIANQIDSPCPLRTFKHLLSRSSMEAGCCADSRDNHGSKSLHECCQK